MVRDASAAFTARGARKAPRTSTLAIVATRELGRDVIGNGGQPEDAQLHHPTGVPELLQRVAAVVLYAENQLASGHRSLYGV